MNTHKTQRDAVLFLLRQGPVTTGEFCRYLYKKPNGTVVGLAAEYRRTLCDLKKLGFTYSFRRQRGGVGIYTLDAEPPKVEVSGQLAFAHVC